MTKKWYHSKTIWVNALIGIAMVIQAVTGQEWLDAELQVGILAFVNVALRVLTTQGIS